MTQAARRNRRDRAMIVVWSLKSFKPKNCTRMAVERLASESRATAPPQREPLNTHTAVTTSPTAPETVRRRHRLFSSGRGRRTAVQRYSGLRYRGCPQRLVT